MTGGRGVKRSALKRGKPLARTRMRQKPTREPAELTASRAVVLERSLDRCELEHPGCLGVASGGIHHRKLRRHGDHRPVNLLNTCLAAHDWIHRNPELANHLGWVLQSWQNPEAVPVLTLGELAAKLRATLAMREPGPMSHLTSAGWHREQQEAARILRLVETERGRVAA